MYKIMTPGPTQVAENVRLARSRECTNPDLDESFVEFYKETCEEISRLLHTDNEPVNGWMETAAPEDVARAVRYLNLTKKEGYHWGMMRGIWSSAADLAVVQAQDLLGLGHESRMNTPSTLGGNWCWRAEPGAFNTRLAKKLHSEMELYGRLPE